MRENVPVICPTGQAKYFSQEGWTGIRERHPSGKSLPNPGHKPLVNHKDGNKQHNEVSNLEWADWSENATHYYAGRERIEEKNAAF
jgi:hypothetical protein